MKGKYLITTDSWFIAPDGKSYKAVWGEVVILTDEVLGIKTNRYASNWYAKVGSEDNHIIIAGCQIHYAVKSEKCPNVTSAEEWIFDKDGLVTGKSPSKIYLAI